MDRTKPDDSEGRWPTRPTEVVELYKLAVEMADRISARRGQANQFYLSLESLLLGAPAIFGKDLASRPVEAAALCLAGLTISLVWYLQLRSYRQLNGAKFAVINAIEDEYFEVHPFMDEWKELKKDPVSGWRQRYAELGTVERLVPVVFAGINAILMVRVML